ncbi:MAG: hypothetical protein L6301_00435 [Desulfobacteraceae bacterium]|nr:hypothetical protein [Pseudomonadota bacterium]MCG2750294.1 hypothetical protein [Desulfobacteraceae bacterium]
MNFLKKLFLKFKNEDGSIQEKNPTKKGADINAANLSAQNKAQKDHLATRAVDIEKDRWWFLPHGKHKLGPFTLEELKMAYFNETNSDKLAIRKDGDPDWVKWVNAKVVFPCLADYFEEIARNNSNENFTNRATNPRRRSARAITASSQNPDVTGGEPDLEEMMSAVATALMYKSKGALRIVHDESGEATGIWLGQIPEKDRLPSFLKMVAASEKLDQAFYISICLGDYRIVEGDGGSFVMKGGARAPGEVIPSLDSVRWEKGRHNPRSPKVDRLTEGVHGVRFLCPTCGIPNYCFDDQIVEYMGSMVQCAHCKNISHVPANAHGAETAADFDVYACSFVPITEFSDWLMAHPSSEGGDPADWSSYGLWAYCADCAHRYASSVLFAFSMSSMLRGTIFQANSTESATDIDSLWNGACPRCSGSNLLTLLIDVPENVKAKLKEFRGG